MIKRISSLIWEDIFNTCIFKVLCSLIINPWGTVDISFKNDFYFNPAFLCSNNRFFGAFFCPSIRIYPNSFFRIIDIIYGLSKHLLIWKWEKVHIESTSMGRRIDNRCLSLDMGKILTKAWRKQKKREAGKKSDIPHIILFTPANKYGGIISLRIWKEW